MPILKNLIKTQPGWKLQSNQSGLIFRALVKNPMTGTSPLGEGGS